MKIAYVSTFDARLVNSWSGLGYYIAKSLEKQGATIEYVGPLAEKNALYYKGKQLFYREILRKRHIRQAEPAILRHNAEQISRQLQGINPDIVLGIWSYPIAFLRCKQPLVFFADATFPVIKDFYHDYTNLSKQTIRNSLAMEQSALDTCAAALYSSQWAAQSAINDYRIRPDKVHVVPFGANIDDVRSEQDIEGLLAKRGKVIQLLFIGVDWLRKGGDVALEVTRILNERGIAAELHIVGCTPPIAKLPDYVVLHGFLRKSQPAEVLKLQALFEESHFLILPSRADCTPIVFSEANSFGMPCISTDVGGITSVIINDVNGYTFGLSDPAARYADYISSVMAETGKYARLARTSFAEYRQRLNWKVVGKQMMEIFEKLL